MPVKTFIDLRREHRGVAEDNNGEDLSEEDSRTDTAPAILERLEGTRVGDWLLASWENPRDRWLLLTSLGLVYGIVGYLLIMGDFNVSTFLVYALDVVPIVVGYRVSPAAGAWVGVIGSLATGIILLLNLWGFRGFQYYLIPVILVAMMAGAFLGALPARLAPEMDRRRLLLVLLGCAGVVGFTDVTPVIAAWIMGRAHIVNLWIWPVMTIMCFTIYVLVVVPLVRVFVRGERNGLRLALVSIIAIILVGLIPYDTPSTVMPERFEPYIKSDHSAVIRISSEIARPSLTDQERINTTYRFVRDNITYIDDPPIIGDYLQPPEETIERGYGDCEDVSILLVSLLRNQGFNASVDVIPGHARVELAWNGSIHLLDATSIDEFQVGG